MVDGFGQDGLHDEQGAVDLGDPAVRPGGQGIAWCGAAFAPIHAIQPHARTAHATTGWIWLIIGLTAFGWVGYARIIRTLTLSLRERDYVKAARFRGVGAF